MRFQLPQQTKNESFNQEFCNEQVYGSCNVLEVTGLVCLPASTLTWSRKLLAVCMLSHERLGAESTLGPAGVPLWLDKGSSEGALFLILRFIALSKLEDKAHEKKNKKKIKLTTWPTKAQKEATFQAARAKMASDYFDENSVSV